MTIIKNNRHQIAATKRCRKKKRLKTYINAYGSDRLNKKNKEQDNDITSGEKEKRKKGEKRKES